ncbi:jg27733 [Pararge aegeria aegeria]|uniref:Jg27733 protein n=1 Tax=Pararge aegeria aegeria TaxID=348720 RepID=A0A8S4S3U7_9NEOP|nr:jg27733 [Pararge aegeria aegeria]
MPTRFIEKNAIPMNTERNNIADNVSPPSYQMYNSTRLISADATRKTRSPTTSRPRKKLSTDWTRHTFPNSHNYLPRKKVQLNSTRHRSAGGRPPTTTLGAVEPAAPEATTYELAIRIAGPRMRARSQMEHAFRA